MITKAFKIIDEKISETLLNNGFNKINTSENAILFIKGSEGYKITFNGEKKRFDLLECIVEDGKEKDGKSISAWLFDPEVDTEKEAREIAQDFAGSLREFKPQKVIRNVRKNKKSDDENNTNPLFLMNRIVNIFPELKGALQDEKENYQNFRGVTFAREKVLPFLEEYLKSNAPKYKLKKLCTVLSNSYASGDLDTRGIITIVLLNSVEDEKIREMISANVSNELKIAMTEAYKIKGKKIKPEKIKKKRTFISDTLNATQSQ